MEAGSAGELLQRGNLKQWNPRSVVVLREALPEELTVLVGDVVEGDGETVRAGVGVATLSNLSFGLRVSGVLQVSLFFGGYSVSGLVAVGVGSVRVDEGVRPEDRDGAGVADLALGRRLGQDEEGAQADDLKRGSPLKLARTDREENALLFMIMQRKSLIA